MMNLKHLRMLPVIWVAFWLTACNQDDDALTVQPHDENRMMQIMHTMMDEMHGMANTNDPDHDFAMMMRMHHQGAINMAQEELNGGDNAEMQTLAQQIIDAQQAEIAQLDAFLGAHQPAPNANGEPFNMETMMSMEKMMKSKDLRVLTGDTDQDFAQIMIDHHQSAIENAESLLKYGQNKEMRALASKIIEDQQMEIDELQSWLLENKSY